MLLPMTDVLALPSFRAAGVAVLAGTPDDVLVRWVHSSEVYEMGGLLAGGEVLLTTGLGLHGRSGEQLGAYVDQIADAGCAGIAMEIGRSFFEVPQAMVEAAQRRGLVLLALHEVVPFERMAEDFHELLLRRKTGSMSSGEPLWRDFLAVVVAGEGMRSLLDAISRAAGCVVELHDVEGRLVERSRIASRESADESHTVEVRGPQGALGSVVLRARGTRRRKAAADRGAIAVALELGRAPDLGRRPTPAQSVISDLVAGVLVSRGDVARRLEEVGWRRTTEQHLVVAAIDAGARTAVGDVVPAAEQAWAGAGAALVGTAGSHVLVLLPAGPRSSPQRLRSDLQEATATLQDLLGMTEPPLVGVATPVEDLAHAARGAAAARDVVRSARRNGRRTGVVLARDVGVQRLLSEVDPSIVTGFVTEQIGPLIEQDRAHGGDLLRTLGTYFACGMSKSRTADALDVRRQSVYARLARIERMLGVSLDDPAHARGLGLALTAWQLRTGLDPLDAFPGVVRLT